MSKDEGRRAATIRAVWAAVARHGIEGTTIDRVAEFGGFSKGVVHYYFASKKELLLAALEAFLAAYDAEILDALAGLGRQPTAKEALEAIVVSTLPHFSPQDGEAAELPLLAAGEPLSPRYKARLFVQFFPLAMNDRDFAAVVKKAYDREGADIAACFAALLPAAPRELPSALAASLVALIDGFSLHRILGYAPAGDVDHAELARRYIAAVLAANSPERNSK